MNANTVYDVFLALPEMEKQRHIQLVTEYNIKKEKKLEIAYKKKKNEVKFTRQDAIDYLLKNVFNSKKKTIS
ncbi:hypothetical protein [Flavobacterium sp.]|jgi:hypothetical protein|uniref:hypothetical protein n=1 Tax=Flavobacterium sp. TaxID=239 RepID=UPI0037BF250C